MKTHRKSGKRKELLVQLYLPAVPTDKDDLNFAGSSNRDYFVDWPWSVLDTVRHPKSKDLRRSQRNKKE